jgi:hypothetical protein
MNLGALIPLLIFAQDVLVKPTKFIKPFGPTKKDTDFVSIVKRPTYGKETALTRAKEGLGL